MSANLGDSLAQNDKEIEGLGDACSEFARNFPDLPILVFFVFLAFFVLRFSLLFYAVWLSFPRISRVLQRGKSSLFFGGSSFFCQKKQGLEGQGCSELGVRSELARNSLGKRPGPAMRGTLQLAP